VTAVRDGESVDTTMGMTPLEGLVMGTRTGSIDPAIPLLAMRRLGLDADACERAMTREGGLAGLAGMSSLRDLRAAATRGDARAGHACRVFELSVRRGVGAMIGSLGGLDALVFTGGIGENDAATRVDCLSALAFTGFRCAEQPAIAADRRLDDGAGAVAAFVIEAREDLAIARAMVAALA
jgi:acetate kinase